jgi:hypothetical protein
MIGDCGLAVAVESGVVSGLRMLLSGGWWRRAPTGLRFPPIEKLGNGGAENGNEFVNHVVASVPLVVR